MHVQLDSTAATQDAALTILAELKECFGTRLAIMETVVQRDDGRWIATVQLASQSHQSTTPGSAPAPDPAMVVFGQATQHLDDQLRQELNADDYLSTYGFDVVGMILSTASVVYNQQAQRAECHIPTTGGTVSVWHDGYDWIVSYGISKTERLEVPPGKLISTLYNTLQRLQDIF